MMKSLFDVPPLTVLQATCPGSLKRMDPHGCAGGGVVAAREERRVSGSLTQVCRFSCLTTDALEGCPPLGSPSLCLLEQSGPSAHPVLKRPT
jgi:hypothetical protein